ncbi:MAG: glycosyltransferase family 39 protein [Bacteroidota bacterium]
MIAKSRQFLTWEKAAVALLFLLGIVLRLRQYLTGRSLWADEAMLALNIVNRNFAGMFKPLEYDQGSPVGFLLVEKVANLLLGRNEYALRLFPLLAGILSIWLFYLLLRRVTRGAGLLTALALFALNPRLVYYSSEVKQYIVDVTVTIALLLVAAPFLETKWRKRDFGWLALAGFLALWFSHPALFVLAGIGLTLVLIFLQRRDFRNLWYVLGVGIFWLLTIGFLYFLILRDLRQNAYMQEYWQGAFLPMPPWSDPGWFARSLNENIGLQFGIPYAVYLVFGLMLAGWVVLWMTKREYAMAFGFILLVTLIASALMLYPVFERMVLFLIPVGLVLLGKSIEYIHQWIQNPRSAGTAVTIALAGFLIFGPLVKSAGYFVEPKYYEHIRPSMEFLQSAWRPGDALYVSNGAVPAFEYYAPLYGLAQADFISSNRTDYQDPANITGQIETLKGRSRVWVLMSHAYEKGSFNEKNFILSDLKQLGKQRRVFNVPGTSVYLYLFDLQG